MNAPGHDDAPTQPSTDYVDPLDDVFGSAPAPPTLSGETDREGNQDDRYGIARSADHPSDISRLRSTHVTNGYREGIAASKESHIQAGFDEGYSLGAEIALKAGYILGAFEGLCRALPRDVTSEVGLTTTQMVQGLAQEAAADELTVERLFGADYFGEDGVWMFEVEGDESEVTFAKVAEAHPVIEKWTERLRALCAQLGVALDQSSEE